MKEVQQRPGGLLTLCILSWIYMGLELFSQLNAIFSGPMSDDQIRTYKLELLQSQTQESLEMMGEMFNDLVRIQVITRDHLYLISGLSLLFLIVGAIGVFMMFQFKKKGFHLYIIYSLLAVGLQTFFFSGFTIGVMGIVFVAIISITFVLLYSRYLKLMK